MAGYLAVYPAYALALKTKSILVQTCKFIPVVSSPYLDQLQAFPNHGQDVLNFSALYLCVSHNGAHKKHINTTKWLLHCLASVQM